MKKNNKAFTLIELLAIIVILAIIAVITIPIILNVIENSRRGAAIDSAYGYKDAVSKYYVSNMIENQDISLDGFYLVENGKLKKGSSDTNPVEISFSGTAPSEGNLVINKGSVEAGCITIDDYKVTILNGKASTTEKGTCNGIPVYYDVTNGEECDATSDSDDCMKWYIYDADDSTYTMILDHNLELDESSTVAWITSGDYTSASSKASKVGISYSGTTVGSGPYNNRGPITVLNQLKDATDNWKGVETPINYIAEWDACTSASCNSAYTGKQQYTIDYSGYKARLISAEEINKITGKGEQETATIVGGYFDPNYTAHKSAGENPYGWLFDNTKDCTTYGCNKGLNTDPYGYWTSSPRASLSNNAWYVYFSGNLNNSTVINASDDGVRPVITVSKSKF